MPASEAGELDSDQLDQEHSSLLENRNEPFERGRMLS